MSFLPNTSSRSSFSIPANVGSGNATDKESQGLTCMHMFCCWQVAAVRRRTSANRGWRYHRLDAGCSSTHTPCLDITKMIAKSVLQAHAPTKHDHACLLYITTKTGPGGEQVRFLHRRSILISKRQEKMPMCRPSRHRHPSGTDQAK